MEHEEERPFTLYDVERDESLAPDHPSVFPIASTQSYGFLCPSIMVENELI